MSKSAPTVLLVDDEENILRALSRSLRHDGFHVVAYSRPADALAALKQDAPDVVLSDHLMPEMTGLEFLKVVRNRMPDTCRIMLTGHAEMQTAIDAINHGEIYRFLLKPWDDLELKLTLTLGLERLDLERENRRLAAMVRTQQQRLLELERDYPGLSRVVRDEDGAILLEAP
ncbi:MAG: response regulator [Myxococcota bacterium]|jgi:DNA-binding NtrC family response regulator